MRKDEIKQILRYFSDFSFPNDSKNKYYLKGLIFPSTDRQYIGLYNPEKELFRYLYKVYLDYQANTKLLVYNYPLVTEAKYSNLSIKNLSDFDIIDSKYLTFSIVDKYLKEVAAFIKEEKLNLDLSFLED